MIYGERAANSGEAHDLEHGGEESGKRAERQLGAKPREGLYSGRQRFLLLESCGSWAPSGWSGVTYESVFPRGTPRPLCSTKTHICTCVWTNLYSFWSYNWWCLTFSRSISHWDPKWRYSFLPLSRADQLLWWIQSSRQLPATHCIPYFSLLSFLVCLCPAYSSQPYSILSFWKDAFHWI